MAHVRVPFRKFEIPLLGQTKTYAFYFEEDIGWSYRLVQCDDLKYSIEFSVNHQGILFPLAYSKEFSLLFRGNGGILRLDKNNNCLVLHDDPGTENSIFWVFEPKKQFYGVLNAYSARVPQCNVPTRNILYRLVPKFHTAEPVEWLISVKDTDDRHFDIYECHGHFALYHKPANTPTTSHTENELKRWTTTTDYEIVQTSATDFYIQCPNGNKLAFKGKKDCS